MWINKLHPEQSEGTNTDNGVHGGEGSIAEGLDSGSQYTFDTGDNVEATDVEHADHTVIDGGRILWQEEAQQETADKVHTDTHDQSYHDIDGHAITEGFVDSVLLTGTDILSHENSGCGVDGTAESTRNTLQGTAGRIAGDGGNTEGIDGRLDLQVGKRIQGGTECHGQTLRHDAAKGVHMKMHGA